MGVIELGHVVLYVENAERSARFYRDVLGWHQIIPDEGTAVGGMAAFSGGRTHHELLLIEVGAGAAPIPAGRRVGMYHFGLRVGDTDAELKAALDRVVAAGATVLGAVSYTHLDVYKRQSLLLEALPRQHRLLHRWALTTYFAPAPEGISDPPLRGDASSREPL